MVFLLLGDTAGRVDDRRDVIIGLSVEKQSEMKFRLKTLQSVLSSIHSVLYSSSSFPFLFHFLCVFLF